MDSDVKYGFQYFLNCSLNFRMHEHLEDLEVNGNIYFV